MAWVAGVGPVVLALRVDVDVLLLSERVAVLIVRRFDFDLKSEALRGGCDARHPHSGVGSHITYGVDEIDTQISRDTVAEQFLIFVRVIDL